MSFNPGNTFKDRYYISSSKAFKDFIFWMAKRCEVDSTLGLEGLMVKVQNISKDLLDSHPLWTPL